MEKYPHAIVYATVNMDGKAIHAGRGALAPGATVAHHRVLAEAGLANMVLLDTGVVGISILEEDGIANDEIFYVYQLWPEDVRFTKQICTDFGCGAAVSVYEPGWMKNVVAMARAGNSPARFKTQPVLWGRIGSDPWPPRFPRRSSST